jgi:diguanylate cyclase (GGDEF)-like protein
MTMLALNFKITQEVSEDALVINLSGRQRMLSQRMSKLLFQIQNNDIYSTNGDLLTAQFTDVFDLFISTLHGFKNGGIVEDAELNLVQINRINLPDGQHLISEALAITSAMEGMVTQLKQDRLTQDILLELKGSLVAHGDVLLEMMNDLTVIIEKDSRVKTERLRNIQLITFLLAMLNFVIIIRAFRSINFQSKQMVETLNDFLQATNASIIIFNDNNKVIQSNSSACALFGYCPEDVQNMDYSDLILNNDKQLMAKTTYAAQVYIELHERKINQAGKELLIATILDVTHHFEREKTLSKLAQRDSLTGLLNRTAMQIGVQEKIEKANQFGHRFACFFIDLNNFKQINDTYGHQSGDYVLSEFSSRLKSSMRKNDLVYRYGGDEFVVLVDLFDNDAAIDKVTLKIINSIDQPIRLIDGNHIELFVSAGVAIYPDDASTQQELLNRADKLMYRSKKTNQFEFYDQNGMAV